MFCQESQQLNRVLARPLQKGSPPKAILRPLVQTQDTPHICMFWTLWLRIGVADLRPAGAELQLNSLPPELFVRADD